MGVDTKAILRKGTTIDEIKETLEEKYGEVEVHPTPMSYYFTFNFYDGAAGQRSLSVFFGDIARKDYNIDGVCLSLGCHGNSVEVMKHLLGKFGGYLDENDCDDQDFYPVNLEEFEKARELTPLETFTHKVITQLGYAKLKTAMELFREFKTLDLEEKSLPTSIPTPQQTKEPA